MKRHMIVDTPCSLNNQESLRSFDITLLNATKMTQTLLEQSHWETFDPWKTLIILPGNGANIVRKYIEKQDPYWLWQWPWKAYPAAKRIWIPGESPYAIVNRISNGIHIGIQNVIVIDDVVSSGETCRKLRRINAPFIPNAEWRVATWVRQKSAVTKGFTEINAVETVGNATSKVPINSLSTLLDCPEIATNYARRHFGNRSQDFLKILRSAN